MYQHLSLPDRPQILVCIKHLPVHRPDHLQGDQIDQNCSCGPQPGRESRVSRASYEFMSIKGEQKLLRSQVGNGRIMIESVHIMISSGSVTQLLDCDCL